MLHFLDCVLSMHALHENHGPFIFNAYNYADELIATASLVD